MTTDTHLLQLARRIGMAHAANPKVQAVIIAGSVARSWDDRYSDIEIDVFWAEPPTDEERRAAIERAEGTVVAIHPYEDEEWSDEYMIREIKVDLSQFLTSTIDRWLADVVDRFETAPDKQFVIAAVQHAVPLTGHELLERWQRKAASYPDGLAEAMVRAHLDLDYLAYAGEMLVARDDLIMLYDALTETAKNLLGVLLGLNRMYRSSPRMKWMERMIGSMAIAPPDLSTRLKAVFRAEPADAVRQLQELVSETYALLTEHMPDLVPETAIYRYPRFLSRSETSASSSSL